MGPTVLQPRLAGLLALSMGPTVLQLRQQLAPVDPVDIHRLQASASWEDPLLQLSPSSHCWLLHSWPREDNPEDQHANVHIAFLGQVVSQREISNPRAYL